MTRGLKFIVLLTLTLSLSTLGLACKGGGGGGGDEADDTDNRVKVTFGDGDKAGESGSLGDLGGGTGDDDNESSGGGIGDDDDDDNDDLSTLQIPSGTIALFSSAKDAYVSSTKVDAKVKLINPDMEWETISSSLVSSSSTTSHLYRYLPDFQAMHRFKGTGFTSYSYTYEETLQSVLSSGNRLFEFHRGGYRDDSLYYPPIVTNTKITQIDPQTGNKISERCEFNDGGSATEPEFTIVGDYLIYKTELSISYKNQITGVWDGTRRVLGGGELVYRTLNDCSSEQLLLGSGTEPGKLFGVGNNLVIYTTKKDSSFNVTGYELFIYNVETRVSKTINLSPSGPNPSHLIEGDDALYFRTFETTGQCESRVYVESGIEINRLEIEGPNAGQVSKLFTIYDANDVQSGLVGIDSSNGKILVTFKEILGRTTACVASGFDTKYYLYDQNSRQVSELAVDEGNDEAFRADKVKLFVYP